MSISKYLDISTCHVRMETMNPPSTYHLVAEYEYGAIYWVPHGEDDLYSDTPPDLAQVLGYAMGKGCTMVRLDADGDQIDDLPIYEW